MPFGRKGGWLKLGCPLTARQRIVLGGILLGWAIALGMVLVSPTTIVPPSRTEQPLVVYVVDHGLHSRLLLPDDEGGWVQYTYGDWQYFALRRQTPATAVEALFWVSPGTLGRRRFATLAEAEQVAGPRGDRRWLAVTVEADRGQRLRSRLDSQFHAHQDTQVVHPVSGLHFVRVEQPYTILHNSNHELVEWLHALGCQVQGFVVRPNFRVKPNRRPDDQCSTEACFFMEHYLKEKECTQAMIDQANGSTRSLPAGCPRY